MALALAVPGAAASGTAIAFSATMVFAASRAQTLGLFGTVADPAGTTAVGLSYPAGFGGPATAALDAEGQFSVTVRCPVGTSAGTIVAAAPGHRSGSVTVSVQAPAGGAEQGTLNWSPDAGSATFDGTRWVFPAQTGSVSVSVGRALPTGIALTYPDGYSGPESLTVTPVASSGAGPVSVVGTFRLEGLIAAPGSLTPATIVATPVGQTIVTYDPPSAALAVQLLGSDVICACA